MGAAVSALKLAVAESGPDMGESRSTKSILISSSSFLAGLIHQQSECQFKWWLRCEHKDKLNEIFNFPLVMQISLLELVIFLVIS